MNKKPTVERAYEIARSGRCHSVSELVKLLSSEGYEGSQITGKTLRGDLLSLIKLAAKPGAPPAA